MRKRNECSAGRPRRGAVVVLVAILLVVILGMVALALDIGWILMTRTQLQAASDSAALAAGTELLSGLGHHPAREPGQVVLAGNPVAEHYAALHRNGDVTASYLTGARDVEYLWATFNRSTAEGAPAGAGTWTFSSEGQPGTGWYNAVRATLHRDQAPSVNADYPLPLILAPVLGSRTSDVTARATAVIMPARGFVIEPGSNETADLIPFAVWFRFIERYWRAQKYYDDNPTVMSNSNISQIMDDPDYPTEPLFGVFDSRGDFQQLYTDIWSTGTTGAGPETASITKAADGRLELNIYPYRYSPGNFGTIDLGWGGNSTAVLSRQIESGVTQADLSLMGIQPGQEFSIATVPTVTGDTGISGGMASSLDKIIGQCRSVLLFDTVANPGNNATFTLVGFAGVRLVSYELTGPEDVDLDGNKKFKHIMIQMCNYSMPGAIGDFDNEIGPETTVFTPLMLIE